MLRPLLLVAVPCAAVAAGAWLWLQGGRYEETENAYVKAHVIAVSADVSGRVVQVAVADNQAVNAGDPLFRIDAAPFEIALAGAQAQLEVARTELERERADYRLALVEAAEARERIRFLSRQLERQE